jgi:hypothetical protein
MQQKWWRCDGGIIGISTCNYCNEIWVGHGLYRCTLQLTILRRTIKKWSVGIGLAKGVVFCENGIFLTDFFAKIAKTVSTNPWLICHNHKYSRKELCDLLCRVELPRIFIQSYYPYIYIHKQKYNATISPCLRLRFITAVPSLAKLPGRFHSVARNTPLQVGC